MKKKGKLHDSLHGKNVALIFEKTSPQEHDVLLRWQRMILVWELTYLDPTGSQIGKKESIADTARVLGRYV